MKPHKPIPSFFLLLLRFFLSTGTSSSTSPCLFSGVFCKLTRVTSIDLSSIPLSTDLTIVSTFLMTIDSLESLTLKSTGLSGPISLLSSSKFNCSPLLSAVDLSHNSLAGPISDLQSFSTCSNVKFLNLSYNTLDFKPSTTRRFGLSLQLLDLSFNKIDGPAVPWILSDGCDSLEKLVLKGNKITGDMSGVAGCKKLEFFDLSSNNFSSEVPPFGECSVLESLDISANKLSGDVGHALSPKKVELENMASKMSRCHEGGFALYKLMVEVGKNV